MNDTYVELLVKRKDSKITPILLGVSIALAIGFAVMSFLFGLIILFIPVIGFGILSYFISSNSSIEYEYLYLDKNLSVDKIIKQTRRKNIAEYDVTKMEILAPASSHHLDSFKQNSEMKIKDYSSREADGKPYGLVLRLEGKLVMLLIEMNDELLKQITMISPRKVFKD